MSKISRIINAHRPSLAPYEELYRHLHAHPELSFQERETAATVNSELLKLFSSAKIPAGSPLKAEIFTGIGGTHGLAAVIRNGEGEGGKTVLLRADMDGLPVREETGLEYASAKMQASVVDGVERPVMHACGHDMHMTSILAAAELLISAREEWSGTVILCLQPAEELGKGAQAMVEGEGGLYEKVPVPDVVVGGHVTFDQAGKIGTRRGLMASAADSYNLTIHGRSGHASQPHRTIDPIVTAAHTITRLQTIVSREIDPQDAAVVSVGYVRAGDAVNIIPAKAELGLDVRSFSSGTRARVLDAVSRIIEGEFAASCACSSAASPPPPKPELVPTRTFPLLVNDEAATQRVEEAFTAHFNPKVSADDGQTQAYSAAVPRLGMSEDCGILATAVGRPCVFFTYGGTDPALWARLEADGGADAVAAGVPVNHSARFAPVVQPTLRFGVDGYAAGALAFLVKS